jgi:hypothetical protein
LIVGLLGTSNTSTAVKIKPVDGGSSDSNKDFACAGLRVRHIPDFNGARVAVLADECGFQFISPVLFNFPALSLTNA